MVLTAIAAKPYSETMAPNRRPVRPSSAYRKRQTDVRRSDSYGADPVFADGAIQRPNRGAAGPRLPRLFRSPHRGKAAAQGASWYIALPIVRIETSQKAQRGVHLTDLAAYIDKRRAAAIKECLQLAGTI
jgi:Pyocin activator protein PrtN